MTGYKMKISLIKALIEDLQDEIKEYALKEAENCFDKDDIKNMHKFGIGEYMLNSEPMDMWDFYCGQYKSLNNLWHYLNSFEGENNE